jgi:hypothetical protein
MVFLKPPARIPAPAAERIARFSKRSDGGEQKRKRRRFGK